MKQKQGDAYWTYMWFLRIYFFLSIQFLVFRQSVVVSWTDSAYLEAARLVRYLPRKKGEYSNRPFNARRWLLGLALTTPVTEVHGDNEQRDEHPDDRNTSPKHQRLHHSRQACNYRPLWPSSVMRNIHLKSCRFITTCKAHNWHI